MIGRNIEAASVREFDLVIVGGGIYGASLLREAARHGRSACLCEAGDFGGGTSWNSLRIVHGGLRYLQNLDLRRFFQSVVARRYWARQFPTLVRPLDCLMPLHREGLKRMSVMRIALLLNDVLSWRRNDGVSLPMQLPGSGVIDAETTRNRFPMVRKTKLEGAAFWSDLFMISSERILMETLRDACRAGAVAFNYTAVLDIVREGRAARGVRVRDLTSGAEHTIAARAVVNCAGPKVATLVRGLDGNSGQLFRPSLAFNIMLTCRLPTANAIAVAAPEPGSPVLFLLPGRSTVLAGTRHLARPAGTTKAVPTESEILEFLGLLNRAIPGLDAGRANVCRVFAGLLPAVSADSDTLVKREFLLDHGRTGGLEGLYSVSGVKFTTAVEVARRTLALMGIDRKPHSIATEPALSPVTPLLTDARRFLETDTEAASAALQRVVEEEAVRCLDDLVLRRTNWATTEASLDAVRARVAQLVNLAAAAPVGA
jgi:glycerol-3-phosphate dehydrogenase